MKTQLSFADAMCCALKGKVIDDVKLDVSSHGVIHELILVVGNTNIYMLPVQGKLAVEFEYERKP